MNDKVERRLTTILAADVAGYSNLISADEEGTLATLAGHRSSLIDPAIADHGGRLANTAGDSLLIEFASVVGAVRFAFAVQQGLRARNIDVPEARRITFRMGINVGDVVASGNDLLGHGVNIAARLEALAAPGGLCIAASTYQYLQGPLKAAFADAGPVTVKNVAEPVHVWRWQPTEQTPETKAEPAVSAVSGVPSSLRAIIDAIQMPKIAVLPFVNMSRNEDLEFFCDGLAESLITDMSRSCRLEVAARNSSFQFKGRSPDARGAAKQLGVRYLVEGSVQTMGGRMRVNAQIIDGRTGDHVWADRYDRSTDDLFEVQDELCELLAIEADAAVSGGDAARARSPSNENPKVRDLIRRAALNFYAYDREAITKSETLVDQALELEPDSMVALYMAGMVRIVGILHLQYQISERRFQEIFENSDRLVELYPKSGMGSSLKAMTFLGTRELELALFNAEHGVNLQSLPFTNHIYARTLNAFGRFEEAITATQQTLRLQPIPLPAVMVSLGIACLMLGRTSEAVASFEKVRELNPRQILDHPLIGAAMVADGRSDDGKALIRDLLGVRPNLSIGDVMHPYPFKDPAHSDRITALLREAGLPG